TAAAGPWRGVPAASAHGRSAGIRGGYGDRISAGIAGATGLHPGAAARRCVRTAGGACARDQRNPLAVKAGKCAGAYDIVAIAGADARSKGVPAHAAAGSERTLARRACALGTSGSAAL